MWAQWIASFLHFKNFSLWLRWFPHLHSIAIFLLKTQGGPSTMLGALSVQLFPFLLFCPVNSSCLSLPRPPVLSPQLRETSGFAWVFLAVLQPGNSPGNRKGQVQVPSFCSLLSEVTILHWLIKCLKTAVACILSGLSVVSGLGEGKSSLLLHLGQNWKYVFVVITACLTLYFISSGHSFISPTLLASLSWVSLMESILAKIFMDILNILILKF